MNYSKEVLEQNYREKKEIIERIESLSEIDDLDAARDEVRALTEKFLNLGFVGRDNFKEILHKFNTVKKNFYDKANDKFYGKVNNTLN